MNKKILSENEITALDFYSTLQEDSFSEEHISVTFLKKSLNIMIEQTDVGFPMEAFQKLIIKSNTVYREINTIDTLKGYLEIDSVAKLINLVSFITLEKYALHFSPYRCIYKEPGSQSIRVLETAPMSNTYAFEPIKSHILGNNHFYIDIDCLCNEQGRLSKMRFEVNNNELSITEVKNYMATSDVHYFYYE